MLTPLLTNGTDDRSVLIGAPPDFDLISNLRSATAVRMAMAFGHMSGWNILEDALTRSTAYSVEVLLGRAFFQTEPAVLLRLRKLQQKSSQPKFAVRLASAIATFHPKVWIIQQQQVSAAIVGSGNLSGGGLFGNVECGIYTDNIDHIAMLQDWFNMQWSAAPSLEKTYEAYISKYQKIEASRKSVRAMIEAATDEQASEEAKWHRREALSMAQQYWASGDGGQEVRDRAGALARMRTALNYPSFKFSAENWDAFLHIPELGRIRFGHKKKTIADLQRLQELLRKIASAPGSFPVERAVQELQEIGGIGRNLATKLLAMNAPSEFVVVNEPVERALRAFGYSIESGPNITGRHYVQFLRELKPFIEESESVGLQAAPALDAFFYAYKGYGSR